MDDLLFCIKEITRADVDDKLYNCAEDEISPSIRKAVSFCFPSFNVLSSITYIECTQSVPRFSLLDQWKFK